MANWGDGSPNNSGNSAMVYARTCIPFGLSAMISGAAWYGHDLGGFADTVGGELLTRWHEWGAFLPFFRNHSRKGDNVVGSDQGREPWRFADPYQSAMRNCIQLRYKMLPYLYTLAYNCAQTGRPMNTPTVFSYYGDNNTSSLNDYDFLVGDYLLAGPVYTAGASTRTIYLPYALGVGWYHWWTNTRYGGGQTVTVNAPLGELPLFVRSDAIIPMGPAMQNTAQPASGYLDINCWPETSSAFTLYEDQGEGWSYTNGNYAAVTFTSSRTTNAWDFTIGARSGSYTPGHTNFNIYVYNPTNVQDVLLNGSPLAQVGDLATVATGWLMTGDGKLAILVPVAPPRLSAALAALSGAGIDGAARSCGSAKSLGLDRGDTEPGQIRPRITLEFHLQRDQAAAGVAPPAPENRGYEFRHPLSGLSLGGER